MDPPTLDFPGIKSREVYTCWEEVVRCSVADLYKRRRVQIAFGGSARPRPLASRNSLQGGPSFHKSWFLMQDMPPPLLRRQPYLEANDLVFLREDCTKRVLIRGGSICQVLLY